MAKGLPYNTPTANSKSQLKTLNPNCKHYILITDITTQLQTQQTLHLNCGH